MLVSILWVIRKPHIHIHTRAHTHICRVYTYVRIYIYTDSTRFSWAQRCYCGRFKKRWHYWSYFLVHPHHFFTKCSSPLLQSCRVYNQMKFASAILWAFPRGGRLAPPPPPSPTPPPPSSLLLLHPPTPAQPSTLSTMCQRRTGHKFTRYPLGVPVYSWLRGNGWT